MLALAVVLATACMRRPRSCRCVQPARQKGPRATLSHPSPCRAWAPLLTPCLHPPTPLSPHVRQARKVMLSKLLPEQCTFVPQVNAREVKGRVGEVHERLHAQGGELQLKKELLASSTEAECTFSPSITKRAQRLTEESERQRQEKGLNVGESLYSKVSSTALTWLALALAAHTPSTAPPPPTRPPLSTCCRALRGRRSAQRPSAGWPRRA